MPKLIALTGYKGSGKDTFAEALVDVYNFERVAFADPLRKIGHDLFGLSYEEMTDRDKKEQTLNRWPHQSPRQVLQILGTEAIRSHWPDAWIMAAKRNIEKAFDRNKNVVMTDLRFPNEEDAIRELGGIIIRINRLGVGKADLHASEAYIGSMKPDYDFPNDAPTAEAFKANVITFADRFLNLNFWNVA